MRYQRLLIGLLITGATYAAEPIEIRGVKSCGMWVEVRTKPVSYPELINLTWLLGYLSAIASERQKNFLSGTDNSSISVWMDNYCRAHPLEDIDTAADVLANELIKKKGL